MDLLGEERPRDAQLLHHLRAPAAAVDVEDAAVVARAAVVDVLDARELPYDVGVGGLEPVYLGPVPRLLVPYPEHLGVPVVGVDDVAGGLEEVGSLIKIVKTLLSERRHQAR